jgi:hypothetical protein
VFIVIEIDGMGNPARSKTFHDAYYSNIGDNTLPDQIAAMRQIAKRFSYVDLDPSGILRALRWRLRGSGRNVSLPRFLQSGYFRSRQPPYIVRRSWDYFVRYPMGAEQPNHYESSLARAARQRR